LIRDTRSKAENPDKLFLATKERVMKGRFLQKKKKTGSKILALLTNVRIFINLLKNKGKLIIF